MAENEINTVHVLIRRFLYEIDDVIKDKDASHKWLVSFAKTLQFQDLCKTPNEYALTLLREAKEFCLSQRKKSQIKQVRKILADEGNASPTKEQIETRWAELYGNETTADGDIREDSQDRKSGTSANNSEARQSQARESQRRAGADSVRGTPLHSAPARSSGPMPEDKQAVMDFASLEGLDVDDAYECWNVTVNERDGNTADGKRITNWKAYVRKWCVTRASNRRTA